MTKTALILVLSSLSLGSLGLAGCASAPRDAMYGQLEAGRTYEAVRLGDEWVKDHPERAHEVAGPLRLAHEREALEQARKTLSFADWQRWVDHAGKASALRADETMFLVGKRVRTVEFWQQWTQTYAQSPLAGDARDELETLRVEQLAAAPPGQRASQYATFVATHPGSRHRDHLDVLFFEEYVAFLRTTSDRRELERFVQRYPESPMRPEIEQRLAQTASLVARTVRSGNVETLAFKSGRVVTKTPSPLGGIDLVETDGDGGAVVRFAAGSWGSRYGTDAATQHLPYGVFAEPRKDDGCDLGVLEAGKRTGVWLGWSRGGCPEQLVRREAVDDVALWGIAGKPVSAPEEILAALPIRATSPIFATSAGASRVASPELQQSVVDLVLKRSPKAAATSEGRAAILALRVLGRAQRADEMRAVYAAECKGKGELACTLATHDGAHQALARGDGAASALSTMARAGCSAGASPWCVVSQDLDVVRSTPPAAQKAVAK